MGRFESPPPEHAHVAGVSILSLYSDQMTITIINNLLKHNQNYL